MTTRERIAAAAIEHGWTDDDSATWSDAALYKKGARRVYLNFSVRGSVTYASDGYRRFKGVGKAERVLAELAR
jgi:hypothetical protein